MIKKISIAILTFLITHFVAAQDIVVVGQVLSAEDLRPLEAASVWFKGTNIGCTTNEEGFFMLRSNEPQRTLIASVVGYKQRQIKLDYGKDQMIRIYLKEDISRKAAIEAAMLEDKTLEDETISIVFFRDNGLTRSQQMFTDLNKHAVKTSNTARFTTPLTRT